ncbi:MAG: energy-coupling factor transporter ATPase [Dethiobacteria bacterium]
MEKLIEVTNLAYTYRAGAGNAVTALSGINMEVYRGEFLAITGQNGSGKSTLARHFNGLLTPDRGEVFVEGIPVTDKKRIADIRKAVGMVFQNPDNQLVSSIVEEDVAFGPENLGLAPEVIRNRVDWALKTLNIENLRLESPNNLSEGQKQLVAIAGVLAMKPECIVLDEPTAHLDPRSRREVLENVTRLNRNEGITIILLTHFMNEVVFCDRMIIMDMGKIIITGTPQDVFNKEADIVRLGLDFPVAARIASGLRAKGLILPESIIDAEELVNQLCLLK